MFFFSEFISNNKILTKLQNESKNKPFIYCASLAKQNCKWMQMFYPNYYKCIHFVNHYMPIGISTFYCILVFIDHLNFYWSRNLIWDCGRRKEKCRKIQEELGWLSGRGLCTGKHTLRFMDRKGEKSNHLAEIDLVPYL